jgi:hypothetical protein
MYNYRFKNSLAKGSLSKLSNQTAWDMLDLAHRQDNLEQGSESWFDLSIQGRYQFEESPGADNVWTAKTGYATLLDLLMVIMFAFHLPLKNYFNVIAFSIE